jgi:rSAM/selenodomain-associated transferase 1
VETRCLVVFSKPAVAGRVKTRLLGHLSPEQAAALHEALLADLRQALDGAPFACWLAWAVDAAEPLPGGPEPAIRQAGSDLGARLHGALAVAARDHDRIAAVGSDHPGFTAELASSAFDALDDADLAIVPALDGGYSLIALRSTALSPALFAGIAWSTGSVLGETLSRAAALKLRVARLAPAADLDTPEDLADLCARLAAGQPAAGPMVRRLIESWGRVPALVER